MPASFAMLEHMSFLGVGGEPERPGADAYAEWLGWWSSNPSLSDMLVPLENPNLLK